MMPVASAGQDIERSALINRGVRGWGHKAQLALKPLPQGMSAKHCHDRASQFVVPEDCFLLPPRIGLDLGHDGFR